MCTDTETKEEVSERLEDIEMPQLPAATAAGSPGATQSLVRMMLVEDTFNQLWRVAGLFADSRLVPDHLRGKRGDCMIALTMAEAMGENPLMVMQNIYIISGKAGWQAQYMIARANQSGVFKGGIKWRQEGEGDSLKVTAYAVLADDGEEVSFPVSMKMRNPKYNTIPELMLRYRSATLLVRLYAPQVMMGMHTVDEIQDSFGGGESSAAVVQKNGHAAVRAAVLGSEPVLDAECEEVDADSNGTNPFPAA
jgi:hypothetical protein